MESRSSDDESSLDEDVLNELPLCAIATITRLRKRNTRLKNRNQVLETELERSQAYAEELRVQVEELGEKLGCKNGEIGGECVETQTRKEDFTTAAYLWHYGDAEPPGKDGSAEPWKIPNTEEKEEGEVVEEISIADQARAVCEDMVRKQGMVYEETSGLYYDYKSGYYYDAERALYYDGNSGVYYQFDEASNQYKVHSTIPPEEAAAHRELEARKEEMNKKKKKKKRGSRSKSPDRKRSSRSKSREKKANGRSDSRSPERRRERKRSKSVDSKHSRSREAKKRSKRKDGTRSSSDEDKKSGKKRKNEDVEKASAPPIEQALDSINNFLDEQYSSGDEAEESRIPCVRIIVKSSEDENVTAGTLYIVTCKGGSIGSKGAHEVFLQDLGCSKHHGRITFQNNKYFLRDLGSRNGTYVNGSRLSAAKQESENKEIGHGTSIQIGKSKLLCHVHPGKETCFECEPGVVKQTLEEEARQEALLSVGKGKEKVRQNRLQNLKKKYGLGRGDGVGDNASKDPNYVDRASVRRKVQGSDNPHEKTETASVDKSLGQENKGFNMLSKMGWKGGGLGKDGEGKAEPIKVELRAEKSGLGSNAPVLEVSKKCKDKADIWLKTQKRFGNTPLLPDFNVESEEEEAS